MSEGKQPWYQKEQMIVVAFLCVGPLMLPMVWMHPHLSTARKVLWTTAVLVATYFLVIWMGDELRKLGKMYSEMKTAYGV